jgi:hypothetical protein
MFTRSSLTAPTRLEQSAASGRPLAAGDQAVVASWNPIDSEAVTDLELIIFPEWQADITPPSAVSAVLQWAIEWQHQPGARYRSPIDTGLERVPVSIGVPDGALLSTAAWHGLPANGVRLVVPARNMRVLARNIGASDSALVQASLWPTISGGGGPLVTIDYSGPQVSTSIGDQPRKLRFPLGAREWRVFTAAGALEEIVIADSTVIGYLEYRDTAELAEWEPIHPSALYWWSTSLTATAAAQYR